MMLPPTTRRGARFHSYGFLVFGTGMTRALSLATAVVLARVMGPASFGEMSIFLTLVGFWASADFLDSTYVRFAARSEDRIRAEGYLRAAFALKVMWNLVLAAIAVPFAWELSRSVFHKPSLFAAIASAILCGVGLNFLSLRAAVFQASERFLTFAATTSLFYVLTFLSVIAAVAVHRAPSTTLVYALYGGAAFASGVYGVVALRNVLVFRLLDRPTVAEVFRFSRWLFGANLTYMVAQRLDLFLLAALAPLTAVGEYGAALRIALAVSLLTGTLAPVLLPRAAKVRKSPELMLSYLEHASVLSALVIGVVIAAWLTAPLAVGLLFGGSYGNAVPLVRVILVGTAFIGLYTPLAQLFLNERAPRRTLYLSFFRLVLVAGFGMLLVPPFGGMGAAVAITITEGCALVFVVVAVRKDIFSAWLARKARKGDLAALTPVSAQSVQSIREA